MIVHELAKDANEDSLCDFYFCVFRDFSQNTKVFVTQNGYTIYSKNINTNRAKYFCSLKSHNVLEYAVLLCRGKV